MDKPFATGFFFGLGFSLAIGITAGLSALLTAAVMTHAIEFYSRASFIPTPAPQTTIQHSTTAPPRTVYVPGKDKPTCLQESGGEINAQFLRCREGYSYTAP